MSRTIHIGGVPEHYNLPWHDALQADPTVSDVSVVWHDVAAGTGDMVRRLETGELDLAVLLTEGVVRAIRGGSPLRVVGRFTNNALVWGIHTSAAGSFQTIDSLRNARFAISRFGSGSHVMAQLFAREQGWPEPQFVVVNDLHGGDAALSSGAADVFLWEKTMSLPFVNAGRWHRVGEYRAPWPAFVLAVRAGDADGAASWLGQLLGRVQTAADALVASAPARAATARRICERYGVLEPDALRWLDDVEWHATLSDESAVMAAAAAALG